MGLTEWWKRLFEVPPPDPYKRRPPTFTHRCPLPAVPRSGPGTTWLCDECGCPWIVAASFTTSVEVVDWDRENFSPAAQFSYGKKVKWTEARRIDTPHWMFDVGADWRRRTVEGVEDGLSTHPQVVKCAVVWVQDSWLGDIPRVFVEPVPNQRLADLQRSCYRLLREYVNDSVLNRETIQYGSLPRTPAGEVDKARLRQVGSSRQPG
jgi:hypothetical protein